MWKVRSSAHPARELDTPPTSRAPAKALRCNHDHRIFLPKMTIMFHLMAKNRGLTHFSSCFFRLSRLSSRGRLFLRLALLFCWQVLDWNMLTQPHQFWTTFRVPDKISGPQLPLHQFDNKSDYYIGFSLFLFDRHELIKIVFQKSYIILKSWNVPFGPANWTLLNAFCDINKIVREIRFLAYIRNELRFTKEKEAVQILSVSMFCVHPKLNKTGTSKVGAISKAQKAKNVFFEKKTRNVWILFLSENVA